MKESTIYEFDPAIYPRKVWVAVTDDTESLKNYFSCKEKAREMFDSINNTVSTLKQYEEAKCRQ